MMSIKNLSILFLIGIVAASCNLQNKVVQKNQMESQSPALFSKGEKVTNGNFTGTVWVNYLTQADTVYNINIGSVTFDPGARSNWHYHKGGQILMVTEGRGLYQERGKPIQIIEKGAVVKCPPNIQHWHGATPTNAMTHIAIGTNTNIGGAIWLKPVTDTEYNSTINR